MLQLPPGLPGPDADRLVRTLAGCLDAHDLRLIARADYGWKADEHFAGLQRFAAAGFKLFRWHPLDVLELTRWDTSPHDSRCEQRHWCHAYACAALLRALGEPESQDRVYGQNTSLAGLIDSLVALGDFPLARPKRMLVASLDEMAAAFLAWLIPSLPPEVCNEAAFFGLGLLWFALAVDVPDAALVTLGDWIMIAEDDAAPRWRLELGERTPGRWLLDGTDFGLRHDLWREIGRRLPGRLQRRHGPVVIETVELIAAMVGDGRRV